jgi:hypothetical protein
MELYDKVKTLLQKEHGNELDENKVMLVLLMDDNTGDAEIFANGDDIQIATLLLSFLKVDNKVLRTLTDLVMMENRNAQTDC